MPAADSLLGERRYAVAVSRDVAVFIDFENIYISVHDRHDADPNFEYVMDKCAEYGRITIARAYADWYRYPRVTSALYAHGIEPMYVPTYYYQRDKSHSVSAIKNSVDIHLCIDAIKVLYGYPNIGSYVLVTGDRDFIPVVNTIRQYGKWVVVIGVGGAASAHLAQSADEFVLYQHLMDEEIKEVPKDIYDALVEAVNLARQRDNVSTMATLKLLMMEILGGFDEKEYRDAEGKPFTKFKDFVRDAERRGLIKIFTSGTVHEVFLPEEDPFALSRFVSEVVSEEEEETVGGIGPREWSIFRDTMRQFDDPVRFVQIYNALRGLRNTEVIDLSNAEIKELIKAGIREGLLIRTTRGTHGYYQLDPGRPLPYTG
jgi:uncharacterized protein (TIGR00288 family)